MKQHTIRRREKTVGARRLALLGAAAAALVAAGTGCGSSGGGGISPAASTVAATGGGDATVTGRAGQARITLQWPTEVTSRLVPAASQSVKITLRQNNQIIAGADRLLVRPISGTSTTGTAQWDNLPVGDITVTATAYPNPDGTGAPLAEATVIAAFDTSKEKIVALTLASTIDHLQIMTGQLAPATAIAPATIFKGDDLPIAVSAVDKNGATVLTTYTFTFTSSEPVNAPVYAAVERSGAATLTGNEATVATVTVRETESGKTASVVVPVTGFAIFRAELGLDIQNAVNNAGWVLTAHNQQHLGIAKPPFYFAITPLSLPPGLSADTLIIPYGLNNKNQIVGSVDGHDANGNLVYSAFLQNEAGVATLLPYGVGPRGKQQFSGISSLNDNGLAIIEPI